MVDWDRDDFDLLLHRLRSGDDDAWSLVYDALSSGLRAYLLAQRLDDADAVLGETWLQVVRDLGDFHGGPEDLRRWAFTIARHRAVDRRRRQRARPFWPTPPAALPDVAQHDETADQLLASVEQRQVLELLGELTTKQREALALRFLGGLDTYEVAEVMGIRRNAVKSLQRRGIARLRRSGKVAA